jgi:FAD/FMN-containing dehydrogenase
MITCTEGTAIETNLVILEPGDPGWDHSRRAFDLAVDQRPAAVAVPTDEHGVAAAVREARRRGLRVVAQCGGRGASRLGPLGDALLIRTSGLAGVEIDARAHRARIKAGARWASSARCSVTAWAGSPAATASPLPA